MITVEAFWTLKHRKRTMNHVWTSTETHAGSMWKRCVTHYLGTGWILLCPSSLRFETWLGPAKKETINIAHNIHNLSFVNILICWRRCSISSVVNFSRGKKKELSSTQFMHSALPILECWQAKGRVSAPAYTASHLIRCGQNWSVYRGKQNYLWPCLFANNLWTPSDQQDDPI